MKRVGDGPNDAVLVEWDDLCFVQDLSFKNVFFFLFEFFGWYLFVYVDFLAYDVQCLFCKLISYSWLNIRAIIKTVFLFMLVYLYVILDAFMVYLFSLHVDLMRING